MVQDGEPFRSSVFIDDSVRAIEESFDLAPPHDLPSVDVSPEGPACRVLVAATNEELLIARDTFHVVRGLRLG
jgi:acetate kinase